MNGAKQLISVKYFQYFHTTGLIRKATLPLGFGGVPQVQRHSAVRYSSYTPSVRSPNNRNSSVPFFSVEYHFSFEDMR